MLPNILLLHRSKGNREGGERGRERRAAGRRQGRQAGRRAERRVSTHSDARGAKSPNSGSHKQKSSGKAHRSSKSVSLPRRELTIQKSPPPNPRKPHHEKEPAEIAINRISDTGRF